ncbi:DUF3231 family protein [Sporomusa acidovorans]|uniref:DUF3231 family protein n=1 Tax=Sporomusa acidovorans (strain ATCC 49682 / DSM 3132 / Mol) TaxID=1123286 RepID=A0ABZ3J2H9_SPOA4|nr:DUF3231 family protein [Sporomusa acidovorans]OZC23207.1 hypothetical protein SPACI_08570 [Sporomusa acidovorans DSM 3132]SDE97650.1 Protein of unknown function [Sporomusa acidovorans]
MDEKNLRLTSTEVGCLWLGYMNDSMAVCTLQYFLEKAKDKDIRPIIEFALSLSEKHMQAIAKIFKNEEMAIPVGYTETDVDVKAPPLFSDVFYLRYLKHLSGAGMKAYILGLSQAVRSDVRKYFGDCIDSSQELNEQVTQALLTKGLYIRAPYIPIPKQVQFVESPTFMGTIFGKNRPLHAMELIHLTANISTNAMGRVVLIGFAQVARTHDVREYFVRGQEIARKHIEVFSSFMKNDDLSAPATWDSEAMDSTIAPFSDKLMMQQITSLIAISMANYGAALGASTRVDVAGEYIRLMTEIAAFGEDGAQLMIKHGWLEQPPQAADRKELALSR